MAKKRVAIPQKTQGQVLREFNHRCALCGAYNPQLHHIDEDPSNNDPENLLPLCPNGHLTDLHNPTAKLDQRKLGLFRQYKDPTILSPQFEALFQRLRFLDDVRDDSPVKELRGKATELVAFVRALQMGGFYAKQIESLVKEPARFYVHDLDGPDLEHKRKVRRNQQEYRERLRQERHQVYELAVEMLRFQSWESPGRKVGRTNE